MPASGTGDGSRLAGLLRLDSPPPTLPAIGKNDIASALSCPPLASGDRAWVAPRGHWSGSLPASGAEDGRSIPASPSDGSIPGVEDGGLAGIPAWGLEDGSSLPA